MAVARQRDPGGQDDEPASREAREHVRRAIRLLAPARRMSLRGDADSIEVRAVLAVDPPGGTDPDGRIAAAAIADLVGRVVSLSRPFGSPSERPAAEAEARATLEAAERLAVPGKVVMAARLATYRMLGALHQLGDGPRLGHAVLEPLLAGRADVQREHVATLAAYLERGGVGEAATALGIHRNTASYRLRRIEALTGWDLTDPDLRLALLVALRLVQDR
jgi:DNA-binding PucR family transcriptional regulator